MHLYNVYTYIYTCKIFFLNSCSIQTIWYEWKNSRSFSIATVTVYEECRNHQPLYITSQNKGTLEEVLIIDSLVEYCVDLHK